MISETLSDFTFFIPSIDLLYNIHYTMLITNKEFAMKTIQEWNQIDLSKTESPLWGKQDNAFITMDYRAMILESQNIPNGEPNPVGSMILGLSLFAITLFAVWCVTKIIDKLSKEA